MANNLIISCELLSPQSNYNTVLETIKSLGHWAKFHKSVWYVDTKLTAEEAASRVSGALTPQDSLFVVDASGNSAAWRNINNEVGNGISALWSRMK